MAGPRPSSERIGRVLSPEEGGLLFAKQLFDALRASGDVADERTWQQHAETLLRHGERFLDQLGPLQVLKMQATCAEMVLKIRLAASRAPKDSQEDLLREYEAMMQDLFAPETEADDLPLAPEAEPEEDEDA